MMQKGWIWEGNREEIQNFFEERGVRKPGEMWIQKGQDPYDWWDKGTELFYQNWKDCLTEQIKTFLLGKLMGKKLIKEGDNDEEQWAREGPIFRKMRDFLMEVSGFRPWSEFPGEADLESAPLEEWITSNDDEGRFVDNYVPRVVKEQADKASSD